jgi:dTDP-4-dehydrorhamnose 3,5-epimerase
MIFTETPLAGAFILDLEQYADERGFFARSFCRQEFVLHGLDPAIAQANVSFNVHQGTIRGLHFQFPPAAETKFIRCTRGAILDVIVDLRPESPTYLRHTSVELTADNRRGLFVPKRFAHGYQVLEDRTEITYLVGELYTPAAEGGLPYNDPRLAIAWPLPVRDVSEKDRRWPPVEAVEPEIRRRMTVAASVSAS